MFLVSNRFSFFLPSHLPSFLPSYTICSILDRPCFILILLSSPYPTPYPAVTPINTLRSQLPTPLPTPQAVTLHRDCPRPNTILVVSGNPGDSPWHWPLIPSQSAPVPALISARLSPDTGSPTLVTRDCDLSPVSQTPHCHRRHWHQIPVTGTSSVTKSRGQAPPLQVLHLLASGLLSWWNPLDNPDSGLVIIENDRCVCDSVVC